jgi:hypothetical protein
MAGAIDAARSGSSSANGAIPPSVWQAVQFWEKTRDTSP